MSGMQISRNKIGALLVLKVEGRLDVYWADHLASAVDEEIRQGSHHIRLDLASVAFLSSAGIGVLVRLARELKSIQGSFAVWNCSPAVQKILEISKLDKMLIGQPGELAPADATTKSESATTLETAPAVEKLEHAGVVYE